MIRSFLCTIMLRLQVECFGGFTGSDFLPRFSPRLSRGLFSRLGRLFQQSPHAVLVPQPQHGQPNQPWRTSPDITVNALTRYAQLLRELHLGQAKLLAYPVELSSVHFWTLHRFNYCVQMRYVFHPET